MIQAPKAAVLGCVIKNFKPRILGFLAPPHPDRLAAATNSVAMLLASNTPFYPLYLRFILGPQSWPMLLLTGLSLPFFAAAPYVARRNGLAGRVWLCFFASLNTGWVSWLMGPQSGVALFFMPCLVLTVLAFRATEFWPRALLTALPMLLYVLLFLAPHGLFTYPAVTGLSLLRLNTLSAAGLCVVIPYWLGGARGEGT